MIKTKIEFNLNIKRVAGIMHKIKVNIIVLFWLLVKLFTK